jgi:hypothetical protein
VQPFNEVAPRNLALKKAGSVIGGVMPHPVCALRLEAHIDNMKPKVVFEDIDPSSLLSNLAAGSKDTWL